MYMPLLIFVILLTVQVAFLFLGNQAAGAAAREADRVARAAAASATDSAGGSDQAIAEGMLRGKQYAASVGHGVLDNVEVRIELVNGPGGPQVRATVTGTGVQLVPGVPGVHISQMVQGPVEEFRPDAGV